MITCLCFQTNCVAYAAVPINKISGFNDLSGVFVEEKTSIRDWLKELAGFSESHFLYEVANSFTNCTMCCIYKPEMKYDPETGYNRVFLL